MKKIKTYADLCKFRDNLRAEVMANRLNPAYFQPVANWLMKGAGDARFVLKSLAGGNERVYYWANSLLAVCDVVCASLHCSQVLGNRDHYRIVARDIIGGKLGKKYVIFEN